MLSVTAEALAQGTLATLILVGAAILDERVSGQREHDTGGRSKTITILSLAIGCGVAAILLKMGLPSSTIWHRRADVVVVIALELALISVVLLRRHWLPLFRAQP